MRPPGFPSQVGIILQQSFYLYGITLVNGIGYGGSGGHCFGFFGLGLNPYLPSLPPKGCTGSCLRAYFVASTTCNLSALLMLR